MREDQIHLEPPRHLDWFTQLTIALGGTIQLGGWLFFSIGMLFFWIFIGQSEWVYLFDGRARWESISGKIDEVEPTNMSENEVTVFRYSHSFVLNAREYVGTSYSTGYKYDPGQLVQIRYNALDPEKSYVVGNKRAPFGKSTGFVLLFPLLGAIFILIQLRKNFRFLKVLKIGTWTTGELQSKQETGGSVTINDRKYPIYDLTFKFLIDGTPHLAKVRTYQTEKLEDDEQEFILYDHLQPENNVVYDVIPNAPELDEDGYFKPASGEKGLVFFLPAVTILINLIGCYLMFR